MTKLYKKIKIKSVDDLPKKDGCYFVKYNNKGTNASRKNPLAVISFDYDYTIQYWMNNIESYLKPIKIFTKEPLIYVPTNHDIYEWADKQERPGISYWKGLADGAIAMRNGEIVCPIDKSNNSPNAKHIVREGNEKSNTKTVTSDEPNVRPVPQSVKTDSYEAKLINHIYNSDDAKPIADVNTNHDKIFKNILKDVCKYSESDFMFNDDNITVHDAVMAMSIFLYEYKKTMPNMTK